MVKEVAKKHGTWGVALAALITAVSNIVISYLDDSSRESVIARNSIAIEQLRKDLQETFHDEIRPVIKELDDDSNKHTTDIAVLMNTIEMLSRGQARKARKTVEEIDGDLESEVNIRRARRSIKIQEMKLPEPDEPSFDVVQKTAAELF